MHQLNLLPKQVFEDILTTLEAGPPPAFVILDSVQTLWTDLADSAPGTVTQVRASSQLLIRFAKKNRHRPL